MNEEIDQLEIDLQRLHASVERLTPISEPELDDTKGRNHHMQTMRVRKRALWMMITCLVSIALGFAALLMMQ